MDVATPLFVDGIAIDPFMQVIRGTGLECGNTETNVRSAIRVWLVPPGVKRPAGDRFAYAKGRLIPHLRLLGRCNGEPPEQVNISTILEGIAREVLQV